MSERKRDECGGSRWDARDSASGGMADCVAMNRERERDWRASQT